MKKNILAIETSCDETAISIIEAFGGVKKPSFRVLANVVHSQVDLHKQYGGVFPALAKREHSKNLVPVLKEALRESGFLKLEIKSQKSKVQDKIEKSLRKILEREPELLEQFLAEVPKIKKPNARPIRGRKDSRRASASSGINLIAVTHGPGLEPALWVGINFAKALSLVWDVPVVPVNHMEGHIFSAFIPKSAAISKSKFLISNQTTDSKSQTTKIAFPMLALLVSGGHTELIFIKNWMKYKKIGETRDDAAGEAFDKVARMLGLPYPGGPAIAQLAMQWNNQFSNTKEQIKLPRPMISSKDYDFSFSGLKTAVLYLLRDLSKKHSSVLQNTRITQSIAHEFQEAVVDVLVKKTIAAASVYKVRTIVLGGGVAANARIRSELAKKMREEMPDVTLRLPDAAVTTDNALMIAVAGFFRSTKKKNIVINRIKASGNLTL
ncbi:MAG: tRNA (adenosine(37)-N6)-threonylcarbamoyltransferase complex transferase subunit TsaD [Patescibacteria group bacterium]